MSTRLVQLSGPGGRRIAVADGNRLELLGGANTVYALARLAIDGAMPLLTVVEGNRSGEALDYDAVYEGRSEWRILASADHPMGASNMLVSGTGLTHTASATRRNAMHAKAGAEAAPETDSMRLFRWGVEGGKPREGCAGTAPEWFYKGNGTILRGHGDPLAVPAFAEDGGEEPELAGVYIIDSEGNPRRIGLSVGNEFSDHKFEKRNYLYLAHSKLRQCAIGPELVIDPDFGDVPGKVKVERAGEVLWQSEIRSGEAVMCHSLANIEHHHFKYEQHRIPGDLHVHFFGADAFSFGDAIDLQDGDVMHVEFEGFGRPLRNPVRRAQEEAEFQAVRPL